MKAIFSCFIRCFLFLALGLASSVLADYSYDMAVKGEQLFKEKKYSEAKYYIEEAAKGGSNAVWAKSMLGAIYYNGNGVRKDYAKARRYLEEAAEGGDIYAKKMLGDIYYLGYGVSKDYVKARKYSEEAAEGGDITAKVMLGFIYINGNGVRKDYAKARRYLEEAAEGGDIYAYTILGEMYYIEEPIRDYKKAKEYFEKSNNHVSKNNLGLMYTRAHGVEKDYVKAKRLFEESLEISPSADAKNNLAWIYFNGLGVQQEINKALKLFQKAAEDENIAANLNLAWIYKNGINTQANQAKSDYWQERADALQKNASNKNYQLTYIFDAPFVQDAIAQLLEKFPQKSISNNRYLIVLGVEKYEYTDAIAFSEHTTQMFTKVAQKTLGISEKNTLMLLNEDASAGKIQMGLVKFLRRVKKGDSIYFYYSGHGIPVVSQSNEPYILPADADPDFISEVPFFKLQNIYKLLSDSKASQVVAFVDSCFSGATDGVSVIKGVAATRLKPKNVFIDNKKLSVVTAGKEKQYSNMYKEKGYRLFSYYVMEALLKGRDTLGDLYSDVYIKVKDKSYEMGDMRLQEPTLDGNGKIEL
ncbi:MAG: caspase family protein [Sulfurimonadaceae bacterium]